MTIALRTIGTAFAQPRIILFGTKIAHLTPYYTRYNGVMHHYHWLLDPADVERYGTERAIRIAVQRFGRRVADKRRAVNWSQHMLAKKCGMTSTGIAFIERGERGVTLGTALRIAIALERRARQLNGQNN